MSAARERPIQHEPGSREDIEQRLAKALCHPVRAKVLAMMNEEPLAPVEAAERLKIHLSNVSYHFRTLLELGCIEAVGTEQVRGSMKTTYRNRTNLMFRELVWNGIGGKAASELLRAVLDSTAERIGDALEARTFERRDDLHVSVSTVRIGEAGWSEIAGMLNSVMVRVAEIQREEDTGPGPGDNRFPVTVSLMSFESPKIYEQ